MTLAGGFAGTILHVDLTRRRIHREPLDARLARDFIGGLGLCFRLALDAIKPGTDPFSPDNPIILGAGPLVGTDVPSSSRVYGVTKFPATGAVGWCGAGGMTFGCRLKQAGYDHIIITGQSDHPVYLEIIDDTVQLKDAAGLWGKGIAETGRLISQWTEGQSGIIAIGQAGENRSVFSMAYVDGVATLGRGGFGAVMGAKNLKAVTVQGTGGIGVADDKPYKRLRNELTEEIRSYRHLKDWQRLGMLKTFPVVPPELYEKIRKRRLACVSCPVGCKDLVEIPDGPLAGKIIRSSSAVNLFTPLMYGFTDYREAAGLIAALDDFGLDMFEFFGVMRFAAALFEQGILPAAANDPPVVINSLPSMLAWAARIAGREGVGDVLARGFAGMLAAYGDAAAACAPALIKNVHPYTGPDSALPWDLFGTMELGQVLEPRGPHVGSGGSPTYFAKRPLDMFPKHLQRMGVPDPAIDDILAKKPDGRPGLKVGALLAYSHRWFAMLGSLGICARGQINRFYNAGRCAALYQAVTGIPTDLEQLRHRAERVWTLYKMLNLREGIGRTADTAPERWTADPGFKEYVSETPLTSEMIEEMIADYYREQGWNRETGVPETETLKRLGLDGL